MTGIMNLFEPLDLGTLVLPNRVLMAPLTRNRARGDGTPREMAEIYYYQRSSAGLIISEATQISAMGKGYLDTPGVYEESHVKAWKRITDAVHAGGGRIFCQLWHVGRISHTSLLPDGRQPVSSSAVRADTKTFTAEGFVDVSDPVSLDLAGIDQTLEDYSRAASCAKDAGFDGVEVHSANGYLLDQFLQDGVNRRDDRYGGSIENRMRLLTEVLDRVAAIFPSERIGIRLSPLGQANDISDSNPEDLFAAIYSMLSTRKLAYLHVIEQFYSAETTDDDREMLLRLRGAFQGIYFGNGEYDAARASEAIDASLIDAATFGRPFIANPDLPDRYRTGAVLNEPDPATFYGGDERGYTDYPFADRT